MKTTDIIKLRLQNQLLSEHALNKPEEIVKWMGAIQAQDYLGSLWAIGTRLNKSSEALIEEAIKTRLIIRSWPMRGTLHFTTPEDLRLMLRLFAPRAIKKGMTNYKQSGLDNKVFLKSAKIVEKVLTRDKILTRNELYNELDRAKISTDDTRGLHILGWLAQKGVICQGPRDGKQFTFTLLDDWAPSSSSKLTDGEALAKLTVQYFQSHGPATISDYAWWSGLTLTEAKNAVASCGSNLMEMKIEEHLLYTSTKEIKPKPFGDQVHLLPAYDEYTVGYKDRSAFLDPAHAAISRNGIFSPVILVKGKIQGIWKRELKKDSVEIKTTFFNNEKTTTQKMITRSVNEYKNFLGLK